LLAGPALPPLTQRLSRTRPAYRFVSLLW